MTDGGDEMAKRKLIWILVGMVGLLAVLLGIVVMFIASHHSSALKSTVSSHPLIASSSSSSAQASKGNHAQSSDSKVASNHSSNHTSKSSSPVSTASSKTLQGRGVPPSGSGTIKGATSHPSTSQKPPSSPTVAAIAAPYEAQLAGLYASYVGSVDGLYQQAKAQYHSGKETKAALLQIY